jgi:hypothetical protein
MSGIRSKFTYANVVATLALFLALTGGAVWAASKIHSRNIAKNAVKSRNIAKSAVKARNLAPSSVISSKIKDGSISPADFAPGAGASVLASFDGGSSSVATGNYPLNGGSFTTKAGQVALLVGDGQATVAWDGTTFQCTAAMTFTLDGSPAGSFIFLNLSTTPATTTNGQVISVVATPGNHLLTAQKSSNSCTAGSTIDFVHVRVVETG